MFQSPRLPIELCEDVIDNLHDDNHTLRACSLVCRAFLSASRRHLFHTVTINRYEADRFLMPLFSNSSTKNKLIHLLAIHLPEVVVLELEHLQWNLLDDIVQTIVTFGFQKVKCLILINSKFTSWGHLS